jgi:hypothetical protein
MLLKGSSDKSHCPAGGEVFAPGIEPSQLKSAFVSKVVVLAALLDVDAGSVGLAPPDPALLLAPSLPFFFSFAASLLASLLLTATLHYGLHLMLLIHPQPQSMPHEISSWEFRPKAMRKSIQ